MSITQNIPHTSELFDLSHTLAVELFADSVYPWDILDLIKDFIINKAKTLDPAVYENRGNDIYIARDATIAPTACISGPCIIDSGAEIRHCAYIRGSVIVGKGAVVGNSCELKNCILFDGVQVPHYNYVGDSILGYKSHLGAGAVTSNLKSDKSHVTVKTIGESIDTGRKKLGAIIGDNVEVGCNSVLCPGAIIGKNSNVYPLSRVRGVIPQNSIFKAENNIIPKH
jgi:NDP-sugar pyrophosphorylase family protein